MARKAITGLYPMLGIGAELASPTTRGEEDRVIIAGRDSLQDTVNQGRQEMTRRNLDIKPTLTERPGLPLRVIVNRDLALRPFQAVTSELESLNRPYDKDTVR